MIARNRPRHYTQRDQWSKKYDSEEENEGWRHGRLTPKLSGAAPQHDWHFIHGASAQTYVRHHIANPLIQRIAAITRIPQTTGGAKIQKRKACHLTS